MVYLGKLELRIRAVTAIAVLIGIVVTFGACDPADSLTNQEFRLYLDNYQRWEVADVVAAFNHLETKRGSFNCTKQLEAAQHAIWREEAGPLKLELVPEGKAIDSCLHQFHESSGLAPGKLQAAALSYWVSHNFAEAAKTKVTDAAAAATKRLEGAGCAGDDCLALTVVGDLAVSRAGLEVSVALQDAQDRCRAAGFGGLGPWRLPTRDELVALRASNKLATDQDMATYWSRTREFDDAGKLQAWVLRFDLEVLGQQIEPRLIGFEVDERPSLAKVRCVHDLTKAAVAETEVDRMENIIVGAGCPRRDWDRMGNRWWEYVRYRTGYLVTWKTQGKRGGALKRVCRELPYCKLPWKAPSRGSASALAQDPWLSEGAEERCVAKLASP